MSDSGRRRQPPLDKRRENCPPTTPIAPPPRFPPRRVSARAEEDRSRPIAVASPHPAAAEHRFLRFTEAVCWKIECRFIRLARERRFKGSQLAASSRLNGSPVPSSRRSGRTRDWLLGKEEAAVPVVAR
ncbi:hypothetical protein DPEC_G00278440 [Dallia pectoralis]|uniref:Uncharacterized protein n=1 Tax=Dallia pectoralis TaxID=75939 RepID=A0ACC2FM71_DALPE|nr:hypothetical protein DPEC_G00278440 [Dallia pectoralis]